MKTCEGCNYLIVEYDLTLYNYRCTLLKKIIFLSLDSVHNIPAPEDCIHAKEI